MAKTRKPHSGGDNIFYGSAVCPPAGMPKSTYRRNCFAYEITGPGTVWCGIVRFRKAVLPSIEETIPRVPKSS